MDNLLGVLLRGAASAQIALPAFNVHNLEFIDGVVQAGIDLDGRCIMEVGPKTLRFVDLEVWFDVAQSVMKRHRAHSPPFGSQCGH